VKRIALRFERPLRPLIDDEQHDEARLTRCRRLGRARNE
jgi:hypothetical protein